MNGGMVKIVMWAALSFAGFLGHLVGDYLVQNNWMAQNKAKPLRGDRVEWCEMTIGFGRMKRWTWEPLLAISLHAASWAASVAALMIPAAWVAWGPLGAGVTFKACVALMVVHWIQDRRWPIVWFMKVVGKDPGQTWLLIVVDNVFHLLQIAGAAAWIAWRMV